MVMLTFLFWLFAAPVMLILIGVLWLWLLSLLGKVIFGD